MGRWSTNAPDDFDFSGDSDGFWPVSRLRQGYIDYLTAKQLEYEEQREHRHYYNAAQWTADEIKILRRRKQPIVTFNHAARKIDQIVGIVSRMRQDPKAYPRNPNNASGADIATQCIQAVLDGGDWEFVDPFCAGQAAIEGIAGIELKLVEGDHDDPDITFDYVYGDDFFYDPRSMKPDFSDARYMGIAKWLDVEAAVELFPDKETELRTLMVETGFDLTTHADREFKWIYTNEKRLRLVEMWYRYRGRWNWAFFCSMLMLDQGVSPFRDERKRPMNRFEMFSSYVDHDGDRYGFMRNFKGPQDETNQRRSKALFISNSTRLISQKGAVDDVERARREYARPDGFVEYNPGFDAPTPATKTEDLNSHLELMKDARNEIDSFANITPDLLARDVSGDHSGVAINLLQRAGIAELGPYLRNYKAWKKRVYRKIWNMCRTTWQSERWIRISADPNIQQFLQVNGFQIGPDGVPTFINQLGNIDVEIRIDEGPDEASSMQDAYDILKGYPAGTIPPQVMIELAPMSAKLKQRIQSLMAQQPDPMQQAEQQLNLQGKKAQIDDIHSKITDRSAQADERRARSVRDVASAAHLAHEANMRTAEFVRDGFQQVNEQQGQNAQGQNGGQPPQQGAPLPVPPGGAPPGPPTVPSQGGPGTLRVPPGHPILRAARQAPDGNHYVPDPRRPGKFLMVR